MLIQLCTGAALLASVSHAACWMTEDDRSDRCWLRDQDGFWIDKTAQQCKDSCSDSLTCRAAAWNGVCRHFSYNCADPADHESDDDQNFSYVAFKDCHTDNGYMQGKGAIWCRYSDKSASSFNCLWSGAARSGHGCKASGCYGDQCCYDSKATAEYYCNRYHSECKGFWKAGDGFWYVRGTGEGGWVDAVNYPNSVYYMKFRDFNAPLCKARATYTGAWGCLNGVCLDHNNAFPTLKAARLRCNQLTECKRVMRWTNGYWYVRRKNDPEYPTEYPGVTYIEKGCEETAYTNAFWDSDE